MERQQRLLWIWSAAAVLTAVAWIVAAHWSGRWPAMLGVLLFLIAVIAALVLTVAGAPPPTP